MLKLAELDHGVRTAWALLLGDRSAPQRLDVSVSGFWRSFLAVIPLVPLYALACLSEAELVVDGSGEGSELPMGVFFTARFFALGLDWVTLPFLLMLLAGPLGIGARYVPFVVVRNWSLLLMSIVTAPLFVLHLIGFLANAILVIVLLMATIVFVRYRYIATRITLECTAAFAAGIVAVEFLGGILLSELTARLFGL